MSLQVPLVAQALQIHLLMLAPLAAAIYSLDEWTCKLKDCLLPGLLYDVTQIA